jgi:hypothetical protein
MTISQEKSTLTNNNTVSCGNLTCHNICKVTLTENKTLKHSNHLICSYLYRDSTKAHAHHDSKYCAIPSCHQDSSLPTNGTVGRIAAPVTQTTTTAVPLVCICISHDDLLINFYQSLFGGSAHAR